MRKKLLVILLLLLCALPLIAQDEPSAGEAAAGMAAMGGCVIFVVLLLVVNVLILIWVYNDAKSRGMENAVLWLIIVLITGLIGLIIYLIVRPKGDKVVCPSCSKKRMTGLPRCPHCGNP